MVVLFSIDGINSRVKDCAERVGDLRRNKGGVILMIKPHPPEMLSGEEKA